jgi:hypothetical protein
MTTQLSPGEYVTFVRQGELPVTVVRRGGTYVRILRYGGKPVTHIHSGGLLISVDREYELPEDVQEDIGYR